MKTVFSYLSLHKHCVQQETDQFMIQRPMNMAWKKVTTMLPIKLPPTHPPKSVVFMNPSVE